MPASGLRPFLADDGRRMARVPGGAPIVSRGAARGVKTTEHAIRHTTAMIRAKLTEIEQRLDHGLSLNEPGELQRMPADLDRAITCRHAHWQVLGILLTETEMKSLQPAQKASTR